MLSTSSTSVPASEQTTVTQSRTTQAQGGQEELGSSTTHQGDTGTTVTSIVEVTTPSASEVATTSTLTVTQEQSSTAPATASTASEADTEGDSPLDNVNFLSFEDWKRQNLVQSGQSPDHVGQQQQRKEQQGRVRPRIDNALDVLGEDSEIELDFGGFGGLGTPAQPTHESHRTDSGQSSTVELDGSQKSSASTTLRSKDAGKTCKERTNYASFDCAATVVKSNPECKSASSVLVENKDSYMLNVCRIPNKFFIVELCDDILIDTVVLANYEFFSSIFRTFRLSISDRYPVKADRWRDLGVFEARNSRDVQAFLVEQPLIWARYLRFEFLSHYGNEYYCPVSLVRVHGTTMMEEFRHQEEVARGEYPEDLSESESESEAVISIQQEPLQSSLAADKSTIEIADPATTPGSISVPEQTTTTIPAPAQPAEQHAVALIEDLDTTPNNQTHAFDVLRYSVMLHDATCSTRDVPPAAENVVTSSIKPSSSSSQLSDGHSKPATSSIPTASVDSHSSSGSNAASGHSNQTTAAVSVSVPSSSSSGSDSVSSQLASLSKSPSSAENATSSPTIEASKQSTFTSHSSQALPTTQESFFKSIHKRLQMLESNATLSLQYIEEQSRILRDAFNKVEKRQIRKTETFLEALNATVSAELQGFRTQYDQLWQSTVIEMESHKAQYQKEILAVSAHLGVVADELVFQKRMAIVQLTLLMLCLGFVLFARNGGQQALDFPHLQQMVKRSYSRSYNASGLSSFYSPPASPSPERDMSAASALKVERGLWRRPDQGHATDTSAEDRPDSQDGLEVHFQPPTPTSLDADGDIHDHDVRLRVKTTLDSDDEDEDGGRTLVETQSSPPTPTGTRESSMQLGSDDAI